MIASGMLAIMCSKILRKSQHGIIQVLHKESSKESFKNFSTVCFLLELSQGFLQGIQLKQIEPNRFFPEIQSEFSQEKHLKKSLPQEHLHWMSKKFPKVFFQVKLRRSSNISPGIPLSIFT